MKNTLILLLILSLSYSIGTISEEKIKIDYDFNNFISDLEYIFSQNETNNSQSGIVCKSCQGLVNTAVKKATKQYQEQIIALIHEEGTKICTEKFLKNEQACSNIAQSLSQLTFDNLKNKFLSPYTVCSYLNKCPGFIDIDIEAEQKRILQDKPSSPSSLLNKIHKGQNNTHSSDIVNVLHITDIHIDTLYQEGSPQTGCGLPFCCHKNQTGSGSAGYWGSMEGGDCDIPERTLDQAIQYIKENVEFDFALWTGDTQSHIAWLNTMESTIGITKKVSEKFQANFPNKPFYATNGNEEGFPDYQFDFSGNYDEDWKNQFSDFWGKWLNKDACDIKNIFLIPNPTDPGNMLQFMENELKSSEQNQENVYIIGHISSQHCSEDWGKIYSALIDRYSNTIKGQFFGHTHSDSITLYDNVFGEEKQPLNAQFIAPSFTTSSGRNPSFRIYQVDAKSMEVLNYKQYRLNLHKYNTLGQKAEKLEWDLAYNFLDQYKVENMSLKNLDKIVQELKDQKSLTYQKYVCNYKTTCKIDSDDQFLPLFEKNYIQETTNGQNFYYCSATNALVNELRECMGSPTSGGLVDQVMNFLQGPWRKKK